MFEFWLLSFTCFQLISCPLCSVDVAATAAAIALLRVLVVLPSRPSPSSPLLLLVASAAYAQLWVPMRRPSPSGCSCSAASSDCAALAVDDVLLGAYSRYLSPSHFLPPCPYLFTLRRLKRFFRLMKTKSKTVSVYSIFRPVRLSALLVLSLSLSLSLSFSLNSLHIFILCYWMQLAVKNKRHLVCLLPFHLYSFWLLLLRCLFLSSFFFLKIYYCVMSNFL